jgi:pimeloyl-ACP methyl ester carboxylesterase
MALFPIAERLGRLSLNATGVASRTVATSVAQLHVYDAPGRGALPTIVALHGFGGAATPFGPVLQTLRAESRRVVAPEAPGHGFSGAAHGVLTFDAVVAAVSEALDRVLDEPVLMFGNSLGGAVALRYALARPERVRGLVLGSPAGARMDPAEFAALVASFRLKSTADARAFLRRLLHRRPWYAPLVAPDVLRLYSRAPQQEFLATARVDDAFAPESLRTIAAPVLLIWGQSDRILPRSNLDFYRRHLPAHAIIEEWPGVGHCPHIDRPDQLAARIIDFGRSLGQ